MLKTSIKALSEDNDNDIKITFTNEQTIDNAYFINMIIEDNALIGDDRIRTCTIDVRNMVLALSPFKALADEHHKEINRT